MSNSVNQIVLNQYNQFNKFYESARSATSQSVHQTYVSSLLDLQNALLENAKKATYLPNKMNSADLSKELGAKIDSVLGMELKKNPPPPPPKVPPKSFSFNPSFYNTSSTCLNSCVGFGNLGANCWVNSLLQMSEEFLQVIMTVATFYAEGNTINATRIGQIIDQFKEGPMTVERQTACDELFQKITSTFDKLQAIDALIKHKRLDLANHLIQYFSRQYRERIAKGQTENNDDLSKTIKALLQSEQPKEMLKNQHLQQAGKYLLHVIEQHQLCRAAGMPVPKTVTQEARLAFHYLSSGRISAASGSHEDAYDAMQCLMSHFETILKSQNKFPPENHTYSQIETTTHWAPIGEPRLISGDRSTLQPGNTSLSRHYDYQILLNPTYDDAPIEELLAQHFHSIIPKGTGQSCYFLCEDGIHEQNHTPLEEHRIFRDGAPKVLTLVITRFGTNHLTGQALKIQTRVRANRFITLPEEGTSLNCPLAYELESFFVHRGTSNFGHYIAYRKVDGRWIEFDDSALRFVSDAEIDAILHGTSYDHTITPYAMNYRLVSDHRQTAMLEEAQRLRAATRPAPKKEEISKNPLIAQLQKLDRVLKGYSTNKEIQETLEGLKKASSSLYKELLTWIAISEGMKDVSNVENLLLTNPKKIAAVKTSWIRASSDNIAAQLLQREKEREAIAQKPENLVILRNRYKCDTLRALLGLLQNKSLSDAQLRAAFDFMDIDEPLKAYFYRRIEEISGKSDSGKMQLEKDPRILLMQLKKDKDPKGFEGTEAMAFLFKGLYQPPSASNVVEEAINYLMKKT